MYKRQMMVSAFAFRTAFASMSMAAFAGFVIVNITFGKHLFHRGLCNRGYLFLEVADYRVSVRFMNYLRLHPPRDHVRYFDDLSLASTGQWIWAHDVEGDCVVTSAVSVKALLFRFLIWMRLWKSHTR